MAAGVAFAEPPPSESTSPADLQMQKFARLSPAEQLVQARSYRDDMGKALDKIKKLQDEATKQKDVIKLNCLNDKIAQVRGHISVTDQAIKTLGDAINANDEGSRQHEFTRVTILAQKVDVLITEAQQCIGEDITFIGDQHVDVEIDPNIPQADPTAIPLPGLEPIPRPTEASPVT